MLLKEPIIGEDEKQPRFTPEGQYMMVRPKTIIEIWFSKYFKVQTKFSMLQQSGYDETMIWSLRKKELDVPSKQANEIKEEATSKTGTVMEVIKKVRFEDEVIEKVVALPSQ